MLTVPEAVSSSGRWPGTSTTPGLHLVAHAQRQADRAPRVRRAARAARGASCARAASSGWRTQKGAPSRSAQERHAGKCRVALEIAGCGQQPQRPLRSLPLLLRVGLPVGHGRQALSPPASRSRTRACRMASGTAARRRAPSGSALPRAAARDRALPPCRWRRGTARAASSRSGMRKTASVEAHARRQRLGELDVRPGLALRCDGARGRIACNRCRRRGRNPRSRDRSSPAARYRRSARSPTGRDHARR